MGYGSGVIPEKPRGGGVISPPRRLRAKVRSFLRPPHYKSMGKKSTLLYLLWRKPIWVESYRIWQFWTIRVKICIAYPSKGHLRSLEVTNRHLPITFDQIEIETWDWCQYVRLGQASRPMCNMTHFGHHVTLTWLDLRSKWGQEWNHKVKVSEVRLWLTEVKLWPWPFKVNLYKVRRAFTRQTRWYQNRCSTFKIKYFIVENPFKKVLEFWPMETSILTWAKQLPKWFRNDFSRAFERCLSFFSTATRSRDHGGVQTPPPPPPAGGGKFRFPALSRAQVKPSPCWGVRTYVFLRIARKPGGAQRRRVFAYLIPHLFGNFCESFDPGSCKVRSPGQVKWPYLTQNIQSRHSYSVWGKVTNFFGIW